PAAPPARARRSRSHCQQPGLNHGEHAEDPLFRSSVFSVFSVVPLLFSSLLFSHGMVGVGSLGPTGGTRRTGTSRAPVSPRRSDDGASGLASTYTPTPSRSTSSPPSQPLTPPNAMPNQLM